MDKCGGQKARKRKEAHGDKKIKTPGSLNFSGTIESDPRHLLTNVSKYLLCPTLHLDYNVGEP